MFSGVFAPPEYHADAPRPGRRAVHIKDAQVDSDYGSSTVSSDPSVHLYDEVRDNINI